MSNEEVRSRCPRLAKTFSSPYIVLNKVMSVHFQDQPTQNNIILGIVKSLRCEYL